MPAGGATVALMRVLLCHAYYCHKGGEDQSFADEEWLLRSQGHEVITYTARNEELERIGRVRAAAVTLWNRQAYRALRILIAKERPALAHFTNTFPALSPSVYHAAHAEGVPVVQALRNYRLLCPNGLFFRDGRPCEECALTGSYLPALRFGCYRGSRAATACVAASLKLHHMLGTWRRCIDVFYALTEFSRGKFIAGGLEPGKVLLKPNFVRSSPGPGRGEGGFALFVGRLTAEKGVKTLLTGWRRLRLALPLKIIGEGPLAEAVEQAAKQDQRVEYLGWREPREIAEIMGKASFLIMPSEWYETFGRTVIEAFSRGTPVIAARLGAINELVSEGAGRSFIPGDPDDLVRVVSELVGDPERLTAMRESAFAEYKAKYTPEVNYRLLMDIYRAALGDSGSSS